MLQGLQPISVRRAALRSCCVLPKLLQRLQACFLQCGAQCGTLQAAFKQRLYGHRTGCVHGGAQVVGLRVGALLEAQAAAGIHLAGGDKFFKTLRT